MLSGDSRRLQELYDLTDSDWDFTIKDLDEEEGKILQLSQDLDDDVILDIENDLLENIKEAFEVEDYEISFHHPEGDIWIKFYNIAEVGQ